MRGTSFLVLIIALGSLQVAWANVPVVFEPALQAQQERLLGRVREVHKISDEQSAKLRALLFGHSPPILSQGNPLVSEHAISREACQASHPSPLTEFSDFDSERLCAGKYMSPIYKKGASAEGAVTCVDRFEFPNIPCEYPVVWATAREAEQACEAMGKRLCDAHEWEGACAGSLEAPDYTESRIVHNSKRERVWATAQYQTGVRGVCGTGSAKSKDCDKAIQGKGGKIWDACGSNTFPSGAFPSCRSSFGVYDQHGNAAEHMNLPRKDSEMTSRGGTGVTEMKGSWFVFDKIQAHEDDCRWRAPFWHGTPLMSPASHQNYHLGFRCCKSVGK